ncbi:type III-B CRISPR-associated protein Cas10/Cmr2 [Thermotoga profunda]|uniref:type III-B CRISPR-associated protein Cas10/Cmr2 n=1 Tax=Thermotoga profunda TaxID=1508420 RepID=UPI000596EF85|nr:type III-B CRISPR-associated protein Cas10/Cmr2 [Thermotoga profunda]
MTFWQKKASALLHDPLTKAFDIQTHEDLVEEICKSIGIEITKGGGEEDKIASAFDRFPIPFERFGEQIRVNFSELNYFIHPLSASELKIDYSSIDQQKYVEKLKNDIEKLRSQNSDDDKFYHALWWELPNIVDISQFLPADTRIPNHSIIDHVDSTAAIRSCIEAGQVNASLVMISIGPVQEIISQARKTIDLWAGSYLLSYLIYQAIECIGLTVGFDSVIYPYLRGNRFVHKTLEQKGVRFLNQNQIPEMDEKIASLPNVVLAILPSNRSNEIIKDCKNKIQQKWREIAESALREFDQNQLNEKEFKKQIDLFPVINATQVILADDPSVLEKALIHISKSPDFKSYKNLINEIQEKGGYPPNTGTFYRYIYKTLISKMNAIKIVRYFKGYSSDAQLDGQRNADDFGDYVRACVKVVDKQPDGENIDLLGTLNATKRVLKKVLEIEGIRYESTEEIAKQNENFDRNKYIAILMMDGDNMGKWVSGDNAPSAEKILHPKVKDRLAEIGINPQEYKFVTPSYHKAISRTLGVFSCFVRHVVEEEYKGMLIYAGGDDILAMLPADKVLECANKLRKMYIGIGHEKLQIEDTTYEFRDQMLFVNGKPYTTMMGENASMSAGIAVIHCKSPLRVGIQLARNAEKCAKEEIGRNAFGIFVVRRSGQAERNGSKWDIDNMDVISKALEIFEKSEKVKLSHRSLYKFHPEDLSVLQDKDLYALIDYVIKRSDAKNKKSDEFKNLALTMKKFMFTVSCGEISRLKKAIDLLQIVRFTKRGERI